MNFQILQGDCREVMKSLADGSVDSVVTDPPYELGFMGKGWDRTGIAYDVSVWSECLRVLKPGGHLLAFGGSRTYHRLACAIEDAGFEVRDQIQWIYGSGFPKSLDVSKAIDAATGAERSGTGETVRSGCRAARNGGELVGSPAVEVAKWKELTVPTTAEAQQWNGWGTALKPAHEPIVLARKSLIGTVAANVLQYGTGGLNIDGCRIAGDEDGSRNRPPSRIGSASTYAQDEWTQTAIVQRQDTTGLGRWPANVIHDGSDEVGALFPESESVGHHPSTRNGLSMWSGNGGGLNGNSGPEAWTDLGSAARFFYCAKATQEDREEGCEHLDRRIADTTHKRPRTELEDPRRAGTTPRKNHHPTVKPTDLMRYLCRLITPPGGLVLDPFCGSGSTGKAAMLEGLRFIGIELSAEYCELAQLRIEAATKQGLLFATA